MDKKYQILVDQEFQDDLYQRLNQAQRRIYMQFMTFEGDRAGLVVAQKLIQAKKRGLDIKIIIDCFTDFYVSDTYYTKKQVAGEVEATKKMIQDMKEAGIELVRTRPYGPWHLFFAWRNHKKIIIIDDACYLGGINISDHNFSWHDFMVRFDNSELTEALVQDFTNSFNGIETDYIFKNCLVTNKYLEKIFCRLIKEAKDEIIVSSPYFISAHFVKALQFAQKGIKIKLLTLQKNNYKIVNIFSKYVYLLLRKNNVKIYFYTRFSHAKFIIIDRKKVLFGSSNFSLESFLCKQEIGIYLDEADFAREFYQKLYINQKDILEKYNAQIGLVDYYFSFLMTYISYFLLSIYAKATQPFVHALKK